jgi:LysM repeat protein
LSDPNAIGVGQALLVPVSGLLPPASTGEGADTAPLSPPEIYEVRPGDTLTGIARRFGLGVEEIRDWNGLGSSLLIAGDLIRLAPTAVAIAGATGVESVYMVRPGDTLTGIAARLGTSINALRESNPDRDLSVIYPGDQLRVPRGGPPDLE